MDDLLPTTRNLLSLLKNETIIRLKKNKERGTTYLDRVFEDFKRLAKTDPTLRVYESQEPYEMIVLTTKNLFRNSFII